MQDAPPGLPFDPATGDWVRAAAPAAPAPDARRRGTGPLLWSILLGIDFALLALTFLVSTLAVLSGKGPSLDGTGPDTQSLLWGQAGINLLMLGAIPLAWVAGTRVGGWEGAVLYLRLGRPLRGLLMGILWGFATLVALSVVGLLLQAVEHEAPNPQADAILGAMTPQLALALAFSAAVGEEILFRGLLLRWMGVWGQALLFGLIHLSYATPLQVILPGLLGLLYGFLVKRGAPLWTPIAAHFVFNYVQFSSPFWQPLLETWG